MLFPDAPTNIVVTPVKTVYWVGDHIKCSADGNPIPSYEWTDAETNRTITGSVLTIDSSVQPDRNHSFKCTSYNNVAGSRKHVSETVTFNVISEQQEILLNVYLPKLKYFSLILE